MTNDKPLVIYHAGCWDGFCAAWVARKALGEIEAVPAHYGTPPPDVKGREVYVLDFSYPFDVMAEMASQSAAFTVLDHHKTAERAIADLEAMFITHNMAGRARYGIDKSGARMAWEFFGFIGGWDGLPSPWLVDYTEDRDLWRHALPESENINAALRSHPLDFALWDEFHDAVGQREMFKREGAAIRRRERQIVEEHVRHVRYRDFSCGNHLWQHIPVVNATVLFSEIAGELAKGSPFGACYFDRHDGKRQWSLRSSADGADVSEVAKLHGGGGHRNAAGFEEPLG